MSGKTIFDGASPKTQCIDAVKSLLIWKGRAVDPMPSHIEFAHEGEEGRLMLVLSNKRDSYYVTTATKCSCSNQTYRGGPCKHMRAYFPQLAKPTATASDSIRPTGKWPGGFNGPVESIKTKTDPNKTGA